MKKVDELTKPEALAELKKMSEHIDFETEYSEKTTLPKLQALVQEGRETLTEAGIILEETPADEPEPPRITAPRGAGVAKPKVAPKDYLRRYQYRLNTIFGSPDSDPQPGSKAEAMKKHLLTQSRVTVLIPSKEGEDKKVPFSVNINGYRLDFPKNTYVEVPRQIADHIRETQHQLDEAYDRIDSEHGINRIKDGQKVADVL